MKKQYDVGSKIEKWFMVVAATQVEKIGFGFGVP